MIGRDALDSLLEDHDECAWHLAARAPEEIARTIYAILQDRNYADPFKNDHKACEIHNQEGKCIERVPLDEIYVSVIAELNLQAQANSEDKECSLFAVARDDKNLDSTRIFKRFAVSSIRKYGCMNCADGKNKSCQGYDGGTK